MLYSYLLDTKRFSLFHTLENHLILCIVYEFPMRISEKYRKGDIRKQLYVFQTAFKE